MARHKIRNIAYCTVLYSLRWLVSVSKGNNKSSKIIIKETIERMNSYHFGILQ